MKEEVSEEVMLGFSANKETHLKWKQGQLSVLFVSGQAGVALRHSSNKSCVI